MMARLAILIGALAGALGVLAAARASHGGGENLAIAAQFLLFHAPVLLALAALLHLGALARRWAVLALALFALGLALFCGDLASRSMLGRPLFPMAAPSGGILLVLAWLTLATAAIIRKKPGGGD